MLLNVKTMTGAALILTLSACATPPKDQRSSAIRNPTSEITTTQTTAMNARTEADYLFISADVLSREGKAEQAIPLFEKVAALDPASSVYQRLSTELLKVNKVKEAIVYAEKAVAADAKNIDAQFSLAEMYSIDNDNVKAITQYQTLLKMHPKNHEALIALASLYAVEKDVKNAEHFYNLVLKDPNYDIPHLVHFYLGVMYAGQKTAKFDALAKTEFTKSLQIKPSFADGLISLANLYLRQKNTAKALDLSLAFQKQNGFNAKIADLIAQTYINSNDMNKAYSQLQYIASQSENAFNANFKMALILIKTKRNVEAADMLTQILATSPESDSARYYLAGVQEELGDFENAIANYALVPVTSEYSNEAITHGAYLLKQAGKVGQAITVTEKGLQGKANAQVYLMHASLLQDKAQYAKAAQSLEDGLVKHPKNTEVRFQYAVLLDRLGKTESMMSQMQSVLKFDPDHLQSLSYLAFTMAEKNQDLEHAEKLALRASELAPQDGYVLDTLGWVLFKQNRFTEAVQVLEKALAYQPSASIIAEHLADAYSMQSQTEKAKAMYKKAAGLATDEIRANKILVKLKKLNT